MLEFNSLLTVLQEQFPEIYQEESENLIAFVEAYYAWLEQSSWGQTKNLLSLRDIDETLDEFIVYFKNKYLANISAIVQGDVREFIKHADDFYNVRGTDEGIRLLFQLLYKADAKVYRPSTDIIKASDGEWVNPLYLEVSLSKKTKSFLNKVITGSSSGATAYVDSITGRVSGGKFFNVLYISSVTGNFKTGELVTLDGDITDCPVIIGSLNNITITDGGRDANIGDLYEVISSTGRRGIARVANTFNGTGRVAFNIEDGGTGYSLNSLAVVSNTMIDFTSSTGDFIVFETLEQRLANVNFISANNTFALGDTVVGYTSGTWVKQANGVVVKITQNAGNGSMVVVLNDTTSEFAFADTIRKVGNTISATISNTTDITATGNVVASNTTSVGISSITNEFYNNTKAKIRGKSSNTYANVANFGTGAGARFSIGSLTNEDTIFVNTDVIGGRNTANVPFQYIKLNGEGSGVGFIDSIQPGLILTLTGITGTFANGNIVSQSNGSAITATGNVYNSNSTSISVFTQSGTFAPSYVVSTNTANGTISSVDVVGGTGYVNGNSLTFNGGGQSITSVVINAGGLNYANGERLVFTSSTGDSASAILTTNSIGGIVATTFANTGRFYSTPPVVTVNTTSGTGANLTAVLNSNVHATATITTNSTGGITQFTVVTPGNNYFYTPSATIPTGTGAVFQVNVDYGYGFIKNSQGIYDSTLTGLFTRVSTTIGTIASLTDVSPGQNYNHNPFARAVNSTVAPLGKRDYIVTIANTAGTFLVDEIVTQTSNVVLKELAFTGITGNTVFDIGEIITQNGASGVVYYRDSTILRLSNISGTFVTTSNSLTTILGSVSNATANVSSITNYTQDTTARGIVTSSTNNTIILHRLSLNNEFRSNSNISGSTSGTIATISNVLEDFTSEAMGNNAVISSVVRTANGIVSEVYIISSGFGYLNDDDVSLVNSNNQFTMLGKAILEKQGKGEGYWKSTKGFLNSDKYIHDGYYYQAFSYEIQTATSLDHYADIVKNLVHIAGSELFGKVKIDENTTVEANTTSTLSAEQTFTLSSNFNPLDIPEYTAANTLVANVITTGANSINIEYNSDMSNTYVYFVANTQQIYVSNSTYNWGNVTNFNIYANYDTGSLTYSVTLPTRITSVGRMHYYDNSDVMPLILGF